eukprot:tig00021537_g22323.t1
MENPNPIRLTFEDLTCDVHVRPVPWRKETRRILEGVSCEVTPGSLTAVLGGSGSGKTTLLNILAGRLLNGSFSGKILANGSPMDPKILARNLGYVVQDDSFIPSLTVRETLMFVARLKLPPSWDDQQRSDRVNAVLAELGLRSCADRPVGNAVFRGVSGGERRRTSIACALIKNPPVLFLDEPTTGLDSFHAYNVIETLKRIASEDGRTVVATIHQPRHDLFELVDRVLLLSRGRLLYGGPRAAFIQHFADAGYPCPRNANAADFYMDVCSLDTRTPEAERASALRIEALLAHWRQRKGAPPSPAAASAEAGAQAGQAVRMLSLGSDGADACGERLAERRSFEMEGAGGAVVVKPHPAEQAGYGRAFSALVGRYGKTIARQPADVSLRIMQLFAFAFINWVYLFRVGYDQEGVQNRNGLMYEAVGGTVMVGMLVTVAIFPPQRNVFYREREDRLYPSSAFFWVYTLMELPFTAFSCLLMSFLYYWAIGLRPEAAAWGVFVLCVFLVVWWGESVSLVVCCLAYDPTFATSMAGLIVMMYGLTAAAFFSTNMNEGSSRFFTAVNYVAPIRWLSQATVANEFVGKSFDCGAAPAQACFATGDQFVATYFPDAASELWRNVAIGYVYAHLILITLNYGRAVP